MNFWEKVDEELKYSGKTRKELAQEADFYASYISKGIARDGMPLADLALRISHALNVSLESLLDMDEPNQKIKKTSGQEKNLKLLEKYTPLLTALEKMPKDTQEKFIALAEEIVK